MAKAIDVESRAPLAHIRATLFILATILIAIFAALLSLFPTPTHGVPLDLIDEHLQQELYPGSRTRRLEIDRVGNMTFDGRELCDLTDLRQRLDFMMLTREPILEILPAPELRYETVVEIIAVAGRASVRNLQIKQPPAHPNRLPSSNRVITCRERYVL